VVESWSGSIVKSSCPRFTGMPFENRLDNRKPLIRGWITASKLLER